MVIRTPEGVSIDVVLAGPGSRVLAVILDTVFQLVAFAALTALTLLILDALSAPTLLRAGCALVMGLFCSVGYFILWDVAAQGRSLGKRMCGLRVTRSDGAPVSFVPSVIRNVLRCIDYFFFGLVGVISISVSRKNQRLGDLAAGTVVVRDRLAVDRMRAKARKREGAADWGEVAPGIGRVAYFGDMSLWDVTGVDTEHVRVAEKFLLNRANYTARAREQLAQQIADALRVKVAGMPHNLDPEEFIEAVVVAKSR